MPGAAEIARSGSRILKDFEKLELGYMGTILDCIEGRAAKMMQLEKEAR